MFTYNFGTTFDVKARLANIEPIPDTLDMSKFSEAIAPLIRGNRTIDQVRDAFAEAEKETGIDLQYLTRYHIIEALCDDNDLVRVVSLNQDVIPDYQPGDPRPWSVMKIPLVLGIAFYLFVAVCATATIFWPVDQVLAVAAPVVYSLTVFTVVFLFPLWIMISFGTALYTAFFEAATSVLSTIAGFVVPDDDRQMLKLLEKKDARHAKRLEQIEAKYHKWAEQYKANRVAFMQSRLATIYAVLSPVILACFGLTMLTTRANDALWIIPMVITLFVGSLPFAIVRANEQKIKAKYLFVDQSA